MKQLTYRERLFVTHYLGSCNKDPVSAARKAGYKFPEKSAQKLMISYEILSAIENGATPFGMTAEELVARAAEIACFDIGEIIDIGEDGESFVFNMNRAKKLGKTGALKKIEFRRETRYEGKGDYAKPYYVDNIKIEPYSKLDAIDKLMRAHAMFRDKVEVDQRTQINHEGLTPRMKAALEAYGYVERDGTGLGESEPRALRNPGEQRQVEVSRSEAPNDPE